MLAWFANAIMCGHDHASRDAAIKAAQPDGWVSVPRELLDRTVSALQRHLDRHGAMRIPVDMTDSDVVQAELKKLLAAAPKEAR
jgi:hypothetical protein